jgi:hypothetical protein
MLCCCSAAVTIDVLLASSVASKLCVPCLLHSSLVV